MSAACKHRTADYVGRQIGSRVVQGDAPRGARGARRWTMKCSCGRVDHVQVLTVIHGRAAACRDCVDQRQGGAGSPSWKGAGAVSATLWCHVRITAERRGIAFDLTVDDISRQWDAQDRRCALTGQALILKRGNRWGPATASIDRIRSSEGYHAGNIQIVHKAVNFAKQEMSNADLVELARMIVKWADRA